MAHTPMLSLDDPIWSSLAHAYGPATGLPDLLIRAQTDLRAGHLNESPWFDLWSCLCHQDDIYSASYAAVPHLVKIARTRRGEDEQFDPLHLCAYIELNRLEGHGPPLTPTLAAAYGDALSEAKALTREALGRPWPQEYREALQACLAALEGDLKQARALFDADCDDDD